MLPTKVTILGEAFEVRRPKFIEVDGDDSVGSFNYDTRVIEVLDGLPDHEAASVLLHECLHCWLDVSSMGNMLALDSAREEGLVLALERQFMPVVAMILGSTMLIPSRDKKKAAKRRRK